ncbi:bifunctional DNA-formamidopyrimidine glycosylase/DNA-(apurinic or apyrimidinic site) lyase [Kineococcus indalonis]|uniref:bifunctional DNA-formamidopyrimidine glycosylase/DNA-(apurinic or apyrimidinic site) lyase n=1 Tax=Kineococcus indalonis TaxID=2696566 RepID=UPI0014133A8C|nr:bifunctional DNA-formamidopyrimidine glycosylase/DNA-(apurinic or apyrimidinic site) lyase [Kineococcus indalonis]NAZ86753.1 bifunctional DNA-formamidopyrimidine glycosylase/DNA-(apurinic or apyrimidinic site) lyase [Kineococcus indalonis]
MPELPEVEVVRRGLARWVAGRRVRETQLLHPRVARRHGAGPEDAVARLRGTVLADAVRRGKYLWMPLVDPGRGAAGEALVVHLGMSGQLLVEPEDAPEEKHLRARWRFDGTRVPADAAGTELRFVDQRTFGGLAVVPLVPTPDGLPGGLGEHPGAAWAPSLPAPVAHIARDPLDPAFDDAALARRLRERTTGVKRALLDQSLVSGVGNIYADEALWRARLHYARPTRALRPAQVRELLAGLREVMGAALEAGGTSFDSLYVNVNGASGYFDRSLAVYGRAGRPCPRCGTPVRRDAFMNRSSFTCPSCQPAPRTAHP